MPSEQVSALLMLLIVIAASIIIYGYAINIIQSKTQDLERIAWEQQYTSSQDLSKLLAYINGTHLIIGVYTGLNPVDLERVYINNTLRTDCTLIYQGGSRATITSSGTIRIPSFSAAKIICPINKDYAIFKVTYMGGAVVGEASKI